MRDPIDRETYLSRLGEDLEPGGREPAPSPLRVVQKFVNTHNHELEVGRDRLGSAEKATRWLVDNALLEPGEILSDPDARRLRDARAVIRALAVSPAEPAEPSPSGPGELDVALRIRVADGRSLTLEPWGAGVDRALGSLLAIVHEAMVDGSWRRMKLCRECEWLFYDHSRNRSGGWCSMAICGNRAKNRSYRERTAN